MNEQKRKNPNAGMTLLEVIIAVSIFFHNGDRTPAGICYLRTD